MIYYVIKDNKLYNNQIVYELNNDIYTLSPYLLPPDTKHLIILSDVYQVILNDVIKLYTVCNGYAIDNTNSIVLTGNNKSTRLHICITNSEIVIRVDLTFKKLIRLSEYTPQKLKNII
jgi:hypothetical protein